MMFISSVRMTKPGSQNNTVKLHAATYNGTKKNLGGERRANWQYKVKWQIQQEQNESLYQIFRDEMFLSVKTTSKNVNDRVKVIF